MRRFVCGLVLLSSSLFAGSHWDEAQVAAYVHHSELQQRSAWHLLSQLRFSGSERVLDVGCGDGRNAARLAWLVPEGSVLGMDFSEAMIAWAKKQYHPSEFPNLSFLVGEAQQLPEGSFDVITSFFSLHLVDDKRATVQGFFDHLSEGGYVICVLPPDANNPEFAAAVREALEDARFEPYFRHFRSTFRFENLEAYTSYFEDAGFSILDAREVSSVDPFVNREEAIDWFLGTWPHVHALPEEVRREFFGLIIDRYVQRRPNACSDEGVLYFYWGHYEIVAQREPSPPEA